MFLGRFDHSLDAKNRLAMPARFRDELGSSLVVARGIDRCISVYPLTVWLPLAERVSALSITDPDARLLRRMFFGQAADLSLDTQGRVLLPTDLVAYAGIERDAVIVGVGQSIEIWRPDRWTELEAVMSDDGIAVAQRLSALV